MLATTTGTLDYRDERFVARFPFDAALVAELKTLRQGPRQRATDEWIIERHRPSVARLVRIARDHRWHFTAEARKALRQLQDQADAAEFGIDVVQGNAGEPWFLCKCGDDYDLAERIKEIPGAFLDDADDSWWVPANNPAACDELLDIAQSDDRMEVSEAAWRLLEEPDDSYALPRSATVPDRAERTGSPVTETRDVPAGVWDSTPLEYEMLQLSQATQEHDFKLSPGLRVTLRPYQIAGVRYLCTTARAIVADESGLGKTVQALATIETLGAYPALVVCPAPLAQTWAREAQRCLPPDKVIGACTGPFESVPSVDVLIVPYDALAAHHQLLAERGFEAIVADESHALKSRDAQRTKAAIAVASRVSTLRLCLSSRPYGSQPVDLAGQLDFLGVLQEEFGGFWGFASRYCAPKDDGAGMRFGAARTDELAQRLRSTCMVRRERAALRAQLPDELRGVHWLDLADRAAYEQVEEAARESLRAIAAEEREDAPTLAGFVERAEARKKRRLAHVEAVLEASGRQKTANIARWVTNFLARGEPLVVFAQHPEVLAALRESFPKALAIRASDSPLARDKALRAFQSGESQLILCSLHAAGVGVALTRAAHVAFAEIAWSAAAQDAAEQKIHQIGRARAATAWYLLGDGTADQLVLDVVARKRVSAGQLHESVLIEVGEEIAKMTQPAPAPAAPKVVRIGGLQQAAG